MSMINGSSYKSTEADVVVAVVLVVALVVDTAEVADVFAVLAANAAEVEDAAVSFDLVEVEAVDDVVVVEEAARVGWAEALSSSSSFGAVDFAVRAACAANSRSSAF